MSAGPREAYARAGVDVEAGDRAVDLIRRRVGRTADLLGGQHGFAAALALGDEGLRDPIIVTSTDGVGTKTEVARRMGRYDTIGQDLVAMCVDDVVCHGARPRWFLDYIAIGRVDPDRVSAIVGGIVAACGAACQVVGGETAEHPGLMEPDAFDLAGFCIGVADRDELIDGSGAVAGDAIIGMAASGLHANGYSLVRAVLEEQRLDLGAALPDLVERHLGHVAVARIPDGQRTLGDALLEPTRVYAWEIEALLSTLRGLGMRIGGLAHITGGGLPGNLPRAVGEHLGVTVDPSTWPVPPIVALMSRLAGLSDAESRATFNGGIGMAIVVEPAAADVTTAFLAERGLGAWRMGTVVDAAAVGPTRYAER